MGIVEHILPVIIVWGAIFYYIVGVAVSIEVLRYYGDLYLGDILLCGIFFWVIWPIIFLMYLGEGRVIIKEKSRNEK